MGAVEPLQPMRDGWSVELGVGSIRTLQAGPRQGV